MDLQNGSAVSTHDAVRDYYGNVLKSTKDLKTSACTAGGKPHPCIRSLLSSIPREVLDKFYGCGAPLPLGITGLRVLDLGSGSGRDCYLCSALVGEKGSVVGIDMTEEQLQVARKHVEEFTKRRGYKNPNLTFVHGYIEHLEEAGIKDASIDLIISNCVINLSPNKQRVLREAYRVLAPGGELYFSDVYSSRRLSEEARKHEVLWGECISGALYKGDFLAMAKAAGFADPRIVSSSPIAVHDPALKQILGPTEFFSVTARLFKLPGMLEAACEDYGQVAIYKGSIQGHEHTYTLDEGHVFEKGKPALVCGNTAAMLGEGEVSWLAPHFQILGDRSTHYGPFDCGPGAGSSGSSAGVQAQGGCSPSGGCC